MRLLLCNFCQAILILKLFQITGMVYQQYLKTWMVNDKEGATLIQIVREFQFSVTKSFDLTKSLEALADGE